MIGMLFFAMVGASLINFSHEINSYFTYISLSVLGIGMSGLLTASLYLVNEYSSPEHRGYLTGIQTFFGVIGIILQTAIGAVLYEISRNGPFCYFASACLIGILFTFIIYYRKDKNLRGRNTLLTEEIGEDKPSIVV